MHYFILINTNLFIQILMKSIHVPKIKKESYLTCIKKLSLSFFSISLSLLSLFWTYESCFWTLDGSNDIDAASQIVGSWEKAWKSVCALSREGFLLEDEVDSCFGFLLFGFYFLFNQKDFLVIALFIASEIKRPFFQLLE